MARLMHTGRANMTLILAIYAAALSTVTFLWNIYRAQAKISVELIHTLREVGEEYEFGAHIVLRNFSNSKVNVRSVDLLYRSKIVSIWDILGHWIKYRTFSNAVGWVYNNLIYLEIDGGLPVSIDPGDSHSIFIPEKILKELEKLSVDDRLKASAQDALARSSYSAPFIFTIVNENSSD